MKFANSKKRIIQTSASGKMFVKTSKGAKYYNPTAAFKVMNNGSMVKLTSANKNAVPKAIRSTKLNKVPKPRGRPAKSNSAVQGNQFRKIFKTPVARKVRSNKGVARGPREGAMLRKMNTNSRAMAARKTTRKVRSNKGVARGPREGAMLRKMNTNSRAMNARKTKRNAPIINASMLNSNSNSKSKSNSKPKRNANMLTPEEAELYRIIFGTPTKGRPTKMAAPFRAANKAANKAPKRAAVKKTPKAKDPKRVAAGKKAARTRALKKMNNGNPFAALR